MANARKRPADLASGDILDLLIVGAGPGGIAAAMRALELGMRTLVVDVAEPLSKIVVDFPAKKSVEPDYGRGVGPRPFPPGGPRVSALHFARCPKERFLEQWRDLWQQAQIPHRLGTEVTGMEARADGAWTVATWNQRDRNDGALAARHVILAPGSNVARNFDIPGDRTGIHFRLDRAERFVGAAVLVVGGGISAAEAVIAISNAKAAAKDATHVFWSYHGEALPRVAESKAISGPFYDAYVGNGNIRYLARSAPVAILRGPDQRDYLSLRIDRKVIDGRPVESVHLEFPKESVLACIGADRPFQLIEASGARVPMLNDERWMLLNHEGELSIPNVFLVGDARGDYWLRCTDFADETTWEKIQRPVAQRSIKNAMWEAVLAVETIAMRAGRSDAGVAWAAVASLSAAPAEVADPTSATRPVPGEQAKAPPTVLLPRPAAAQRIEPQTAAQLVRLLPDYSVDKVFPFTKDVLSIGRHGTDIESPEDVFLSDRHALVTATGGGYVLSDTGSATGIWLRVSDPAGRVLAADDQVWLGKQILGFDRVANRWRVTHSDLEGTPKATFFVESDGLFLGRGSGRSLDDKDDHLSRRHAQLRIDGTDLRLFDLGSKNGTFVRLTSQLVLKNGDQFYVGTYLYRFDRTEPVSPLLPTDVVTDKPVAPPVAAPGITIRLEHGGVVETFPCTANQTILDGYIVALEGRFADSAAKPIDYSCKKGICGLCVVKIVDGADNLATPATKKELDTLVGNAGVARDGRQFRLACLAKAAGPVLLRSVPADG